MILFLLTNVKLFMLFRIKEESSKTVILFSLFYTYFNVLCFTVYFLFSLLLFWTFIDIYHYFYLWC